MPALFGTVHKAYSFIEPALALGRSATSIATSAENGTNQDGLKCPEWSIVELLAHQAADRAGFAVEPSRPAVVKKASELLHEVHQAVRSEEEAEGTTVAYDNKLMAAVYGLLDLIIYQAILPSLSKGVEYPSRPRSVLVTAASVSPGRDINLLAEIIPELARLLEVRGVGIEGYISQRGLPDLISALSELAFSPATSQDLRLKFQSHFQRLFDSTPTSRLLPVLTYYLGQNRDMPLWLRAELSGRHALLPLRPHGVRAVIDFIAASHWADPTFEETKEKNSAEKGPLMTLEAVAHATKLLSSVPRSLTPEGWFSGIQPQLLSLLDGEAGPGLSRAAGQIIGGGILGRRSIGAPGQIGWILFAEPILVAINPSLNRTTAEKGFSARRGPNLGPIIVPEQELSRGLRQLFTIISSHPNPGLTKRLISPLLLPLWGLLNYARAASKRKISSAWADMAQHLLERYIKLSADANQVDTLATSILWDGDTYWTYGAGSEGGIEIRRREAPKEDIANMLERMESVSDRVSAFVKLLSAGELEDETMSQVLLNSIRRWLYPHGDHANKRSLEMTPEVDPLQAFANLKLTQTLLETFKDRLAKHPLHVLQLIRQILEEFVEDAKAEKKQKEGLRKATYASLGNIVQGNIAKSEKTSDFSNSDSEDLLSFAISTLHALITAGDFNRTPETAALMASFLNPLQYLAASPSISPTLRTSVGTLIPFISMPSSAPNSTPIDTLAADRLAHASALDNLCSDQPPIRTSALYTLHDLIVRGSPVLDIPSTTLLLLRQGLTDPEEFVYLAAIRALVALSALSPRMVVRVVVDAFVDPEEKSAEVLQAVDWRLRIGEALCGTLEADFWDALGAVQGAREKEDKCLAVKLIADGAVKVAGRRGKRPKTVKMKQEKVDREEAERVKRRKAVEEAWGGEIPQLPLGIDEEIESERERMERELLSGIVKGWEETGLEEDVRVRTSALAVLGIVVERRFGLLENETLNSTVQLVLAACVLEKGDEKAILRRAAVLVIMGLLRALDTALEGGKEEEVKKLDGMNWEEVERVMNWVADMDEDQIVKGHAKTALEALETWRMKSLFGLRSEMPDLTPRFGLEGKLRGLEVDPEIGVNTGQRLRPVIEEME